MATMQHHPSFSVQLQAEPPREKVIITGSTEEMTQGFHEWIFQQLFFGEAWVTTSPIEIPVKEHQQHQQLEFKFVRRNAQHDHEWESGKFRQLEVEVGSNTREVLVTGGFNDTLACRDLAVEEAAELGKSKSAPLRLPAEHWRLRFEETQKELLALQQKAIAQERLFQEEERQAAVEEAALRVELAKVKGAVEVMRALKKEKKRQQTSEPSGSSEAIGDSTGREEQTTDQQRRGILTPVLQQKKHSERNPVGRAFELHRRGSAHFSSNSSTASATPSTRRASLQLRFGQGGQGGSMAPSLLGPVAATPKCNSPVGSTTASSKVSVDHLPQAVVHEIGYIPKVALTQ
eukprot:s1410_g3.t1